MVTACLECESGVQLIPILQMDGRIQFQPEKGLLRAHFNDQDHSLFWTHREHKHAKNLVHCVSSIISELIYHAKQKIQTLDQNSFQPFAAI